MSVLGRPHGSAGSVASRGLAGKTFHFGGYGIGSFPMSFIAIVPVYPVGARAGEPSPKSQTCAKYSPSGTPPAGA